MMNEQQMYAFIEKVAQENHLIQTMKALPYACKMHEGQFRKGVKQIPYICHPLTLACHAIAFGIKNDDIIAACLLHDVCEDCGVAPSQLPVGERTKNIVSLLTFRKEGFASKADAKEIYFNNLKEDTGACLVKLMDRCNNVSEMAHAFSETKLVEYIDETRTYILPLADYMSEVRVPYSEQVFALKYHIVSVIDTIETMLLRISL